MENKVNLVELLKDCPSGMELDCTIWDNVYFERINENVDYPIRIKIGEIDTINLTKCGCWDKHSNAKCVIFPKGKTTWEGFQRPFKDGDVITGENCVCSYIAIFKKFMGGVPFKHHVCLTDYGEFKIDGQADNANLRFAAEEEKQKLFKVIKDNGYKWNAETKTLEELITPKFKVGDRIRHKKTNKNDVYEISKVYDDSYGLVSFTWMIYMKYQDQYELVPNKFDITTLNTFDKVLVRCSDNSLWNPQFFANYRQNSKFPFVCTYNSWSQCIPYEGNEHLSNTTKDCDEYYKVWE